MSRKILYVPSVAWDSPSLPRLYLFYRHSEINTTHSPRARPFDLLGICAKLSGKIVERYFNWPVILYRIPTPQEGAEKSRAPWISLGKGYEIR